MTWGKLGRILAVGACLAVAPSARGQQPAAPAPLVVRVGVDVVQIDAVVTDGKRHVTDLEAEDFEVYEDGKRREISHCRYVVVDAAPPAPKPEKKKPVDPADATPPPTPEPLARDEVRRAMALVVDDLNLSASSIHSVRHGLGKFVEDEMRPGDVVALFRTRGGTGVLQQFTNDRRVLKAAVEDLLYYPPIGFGHDLFEGPDAVMAPVEGGSLESEQRNYFNNVLGNATLGAIMRVLDGLRELPGRKSVTVFSERLYLLDYTENSINPRLRELLQRVTDLANRASVVIYTVDPRGVPVIGMGADVSGRNMRTGADYGRELQRQTKERFDTEAGLAVLAEQTGGRFFAKENRVDAAVRDVMDDQKGYYLIAYVPDEATFARKNQKALFHNLKVSVKRPGLSVRTRAGFMGEPDRPQPRPAAPSTEERLLSAAMSPFAVNDVAVRLTSIFGHDPRQGYVVRSFLHVDGSGLTFRKSRRPGLHETKFQLAAAAFGDNGEMMQDIARDITFPVPSEKVERAQREGVLLVFNVPLRKPGAYQFRAALRDAVSNRFGSAQQFVFIPDLGKRRLALSGVLVGRVPRGGDDGGVGVSADEAELSPAVRRFPPGSEVTYGFAVYHAQTDKEGKAQLETQMRLVRDGKEVARHALEGAAMRALELPKGPKVDKLVKRVPGFAVGGGFRLPSNLEPGDYALQMIVTDRLAKGKHTKTAQWTAFQIVPDQRAGLLR